MNCINCKTKASVVYEGNSMCPKHYKDRIDAQKVLAKWRRQFYEAQRKDMDELLLKSI